VVRGGSWGHDARYLRSANRGGLGPDYRDTYVGFRLVRTPGVPGMGNN
jgi:formylglycine-generating enzyme required for sulfatase activity